MWADGEATSDQPNVARYLFLTGLWRAVHPDGAPWDGGDPAAERVLAAGADPADLGAVIRQAQIDLLYEVVQLLDDSAHGIEDLQEGIPETIQWRLCEVDEDERPTGRVVRDVHASFHKMDPAGRDGEPPPEPARATRARPRRTRRST